MTPPNQIIGPIQDTGADIVPLTSLEQMRQFIQASKAESTVRGYQSDWRQFLEWCQAHDIQPLPASPEAVASYIAECAERLKVGSLQRCLNAIAEAHKAMGFESPTSAGIVRNTLKGIKRTMGTAVVPKAPTLIEDIRAMVEATDSGLIGARDRALILLGFAGAFRRSEIVSLDLEDCVFSKDGLTVTLRRSKTDQEGTGRKIGIPYGSNAATCPVRSLIAWIEVSATTTGPLFRGTTQAGSVPTARLCDRTVARRIQFYAGKIGKNAADFGGHSLRAGHATSAAIGGASERAIMNQTGHRSVSMVRRYIRDANLFRENSSRNLGL